MYMKESRGGGRRTPPVRPVEKIELSEKHFPVRMVIAILLVIAAAVAFAVTAVNCLRVESGWQTVTVTSRQYPASTGDFSLYYEFGKTEQSARAEKKAVEAAWLSACEYVYKVFSPEGEFDGVTGLAALNAHVNEPVAVEPLLYDALKLLSDYGDRHAFLAPLYSDYDNLFSSDDDSFAAECDPRKNSDTAAFFAAVTAYVERGEVSVTLTDDGKACLSVSENYLAFAAENSITVYMDLYWMRGAFAVDALAERMKEAGFTHGIISSTDGFSRSLDSREDTAFSFRLYDRVENETLVAASVSTGKKVSVVSMQDFSPDPDSGRYYVYADGERRSPYVDMDGLCRAAVPSFVGYSETMGCAETMLCMTKIYISDNFDAAHAAALTNRGMEIVYLLDHCVYSSDGDSVTTATGYDKRDI